MGNEHMKKSFFAMGAVASLLLSGCGYKPLNAPCSMGEGGEAMRNEIAPSTSHQRGQATQSAAPALSYAQAERPPVAGVFASVRGGDCGPLRPINSGALR